MEAVGGGPAQPPFPHRGRAAPSLPLSPFQNRRCEAQDVETLKAAMFGLMGHNTKTGKAPADLKQPRWISCPGTAWLDKLAEVGAARAGGMAGQEWAVTAAGLPRLFEACL